MIARFVAGQFRTPTGFFGRLVGTIMARGNVLKQGWTVSLLNLQAEEHILEIGFGPGVAIQYAAQQAVTGQVAGIDSSDTMVQVARKRNAAAIKSGRVDLRQGEVSSLPYPDASFEKAFTIHCLYFWVKPIESLKEVRRVLKPGGLLAVTILPKEKWPQGRRTPPPDVFTLYSGSEVVQLLSSAGFRDVRVEMSPQADSFPGECILAVQ